MDSSAVRVACYAMGTQFELLLVGTDPDYLRDAGAQVVEEIERLEAQLSHYRDDSDVCYVNRNASHGPVRLEPGLFELLQRCVAISAASGGAFDCTAGPLIKTWGFFRGQGTFAEPEAVSAALERVGSRYLEFDASERTVRFGRPGMEVHLGGVGKGWALDKAAGLLRELQVESALLHGGTSTVYALGAPPGETAWTVGFCDPRNRERRLATVRLRDCALSVSGDYEQFFEFHGQRYSHLLDPRTGQPARNTWSAAAVAESATDTDALSTAAFVLGAEEAPLLLRRYPDIGILMVPAAETSVPEVQVFGTVDVAFLDDAD